MAKFRVTKRIQHSGKWYGPEEEDTELELSESYASALLAAGALEPVEEQVAKA